MTSTYVDLELVHVTATCCHTEFGLPRSLYRECHEKGRHFHCPGCGARRVFIETENTKLKKQVDKLERKLRDEEGRKLEARRQRDSVRKAHRKMRDRIKNGVCPCCSRSFENLLRHMQSKHPEWGEPKQLKTVRELYGMTQYDLATELGVQQNHISQFECEKNVASWAKDQIEMWLEEQAT